MNILRTLTVRKQLIATFLLVTLGFAVGGAVGDRVSARLHSQAEQVYETALIPVGAMGALMRGIHDGRAQLLLGLQHDPGGEWNKMHDHPLERHADNYQKAVDTANEALSVYLGRSGLPEEERRLLQEVGAGMEAYGAAGKEALAALKSGDFHLANANILKKVNPAMATLEKKVQVLEASLVERAKRQNAANGEFRQQMALLTWCFAGLGILMLWGMYFYLTSNITKPLARVKEAVGRVAQGDLSTRIEASGGSEFDSVLRSVGRMQDSLRELMAEIQKASQVVSSNATLLSGQIDETARRSEIQADRVHEISAALDEMSHTIESVSGGAAGVDGASQQARGLAEEGAANMDENLATVNRIVATVKDSSAAIEELCSSMQHINELANIIKDIAGQTNLLALNAAIEAARAGEQGRGFAVVADEVRKLAERTASSSANIGELLSGVGARSDQAIAAMRQVMADVERGAEQSKAMGATLRLILDAAGKVSDLSGHIAAATKQQSEASALTVESMNTISSLTEGNNAAIQHVAVAASEMSEVAGRLQTLVGRFRFAG